MHRRQIVTLLASTAVLALQFVPGSAWADIISFEIGTRAELSVNNTVATVSGTVTCDAGEDVDVSVQIIGQCFSAGSLG